jgi:hypothetical protein
MYAGRQGRKLKITIGPCFSIKGHTFFIVRITDFFLQKRRREKNKIALFSMIPGRRKKKKKVFQQNQKALKIEEMQFHLIFYFHSFIQTECPVKLESDAIMSDSTKIESRLCPNADLTFLYHQAEMLCLLQWQCRLIMHGRYIPPWPWQTLHPEMTQQPVTNDSSYT